MTERELIRDMRKEMSDIMRFCSNEAKCVRCKIIRMIDEGLEKVEETVKLKKAKAWDMHDAARLKSKANKELRSGSPNEAVKLYNQALKLERIKRMPGDAHL